MLEGFTDSTGSASYQVLARRTRPQSFAELVGQEAVTASLGTILQSGKIPHAFLFTGTRGTGKTSSARILAKSLCCAEGPTLSPCQACHHCVQITACAHEDVLEIDAATNTGVDNIRELREAARFYPGSARFKIFIIDEVHMLSIGAFNALLKTLEEPPPQVVFILATTELQKVPVTVRSRCMTFSFRKYSAERIATHLRGLLEKEGLTYDDEAIALVAREAKGSMRDSLSLLEQVIAFSGGRHVDAGKARAALSVMGEELAQRLFSALCGARSDDALEALREADDASLDVATLLDTTATFARHALVLKHVGDRVKAARLTSLLPSEMDALSEVARAISPVALGEFYKLLSAASRDAARSTNPLQWAEVASIDCIARADWLSAGELLGLVAGDPGGPPGNGGGAPRAPGLQGNGAAAASPVRAMPPAAAMGTAGTAGTAGTMASASVTVAAGQAPLPQGPGPSPWASGAARGPIVPQGGGASNSAPAAPEPAAPAFDVASPATGGVDLPALQGLIARVERQSPGLASKLRNAVFDEFNARRVAYAAVPQNSLYTDFSEGDAALLVESLRASGFGAAELSGVQFPRGVTWKPAQSPFDRSQGAGQGAGSMAGDARPGEGLPPPRPRAGFLEKKPSAEKKSNVTEAPALEEAGSAPGSPAPARTADDHSGTTRPSPVGQSANTHSERPSNAQPTAPAATQPAATQPSLVDRLEHARPSHSHSTQPTPPAQRMHEPLPIPSTPTAPQVASCALRPEVPPAAPCAHPSSPTSATAVAARHPANSAAPSNRLASEPSNTAAPARSVAPAGGPLAAARVSLAAHEKIARDKDFQERATRLLERPELSELKRRATGAIVVPIESQASGE